MRLTKVSVAAAILFSVALVVSFGSMSGSEFIMLPLLATGTFCLGTLVVGLPFLARFAMSSPDVDRAKLPKYRLAPFLVLMAAAIILGSVSIAVNYVGATPFERTVIRHVDNAEESAILANAEKLDFGAIFSVERINNTDGAPRCRFIDRKAIDAYSNRVGELQSAGPPNRAIMRYEADVYPVESLRLQIDSRRDLNFNITLEPLDRSFWGFMDQNDDSRLAMWNGTAYNRMDARSGRDIDNFSLGGHLVVMKLVFSTGTSAFNMESSEARQYVYFDPGGIARWIAFERHDGNVEW